MFSLKLSHPEIELDLALHYLWRPKLQITKTYPKKYSLSLKFQYIQEIEHRLLTTTGTLEKHGVQAILWLERSKNNRVTLIINMQTFFSLL